MANRPSHTTRVVRWCLNFASQNELLVCSGHVLIALTLVFLLSHISSFLQVHFKSDPLYLVEVEKVFYRVAPWLTIALCVRRTWRGSLKGFYDVKDETDSEEEVTNTPENAGESDVGEV